MRLGQLARSLNTTTTDIVKFLAEQDLVVTDHPNVKLPKETEQEVIHAFKPANPKTHEKYDSLETENAQTDLKEQEEVRHDKEKQPEPDSALDRKTDQDQAISTKEAAGASEVEEAEIEIIKAPKIELQGLKVIGKIDLPEPTPREKPEVQTKEKETKKSSTKKRGYKKSPLSEEEKEKRRLKQKKARLKRQQQEHEKRKEQEQRERKEQKKQHYLRKINKPPSETKKAKSKVPTPAKESVHNRPKTLLGRFWKWLNT